MNIITKIIALVNKEHSFLSKALILLLLTRLMFLEDNTLALISEIIGSLAVIASGVCQKKIDIDEE